MTPNEKNAMFVLVLLVIAILGSMGVAIPHTVIADEEAKKADARDEPGTATAYRFVSSLIFWGLVALVMAMVMGAPFLTSALNASH